jgi:ABC-type Mn2+/Zn2+ transport system permease subunit
MSSLESASPTFGARDAVAGVLAAASIALSLVALADRPGRLVPIAIVVAIVAARMSARFERLAFAAVVIGMIAFVVGMTIAVITENTLI